MIYVSHFLLYLWVVSFMAYAFHLATFFNLVYQPENCPFLNDKLECCVSRSFQLTRLS